MRNKATLLLLLSASLVTGLYLVERLQATPPNSGFTASTIAKGTFGPIDVFNRSITPASGNEGQGDRDDRRADVWLSTQRTRGESDLYVQNNTWQPGGSTGWHSHPGHSLIIVTSGTITDYESDDPNCAPHVYTAGMGVVDSGGDHVHLIRNESNAVATTVAVQLIPSGATRRIDAPAPANCSVY